MQIDAKIIKSMVRRHVPSRAIYRVKRFLGEFQLLRSGAAQAFARAGTQPEWLSLDELARLHREYPPTPVAIAPDGTWASYTHEALRQNARERSRQLLLSIGKGAAHVRDSLELGCADGMVSGELAARGLCAVGIDIRDTEFSARALSQGATLRAMDVAHLDFADASFDLVFSFASVEHFPDPDAALAEAARVCRPGGYIYLSFGPLWNSWSGPHMDVLLGVPYAHLLFRRDDIDAFCVREGIAAINWKHCNEWPLYRYRALWEKYSDRLEICWNRETLDTSHLGIIERYPSCFRAKVGSFDELVVGYIEILFKKREGS